MLGKNRIISHMVLLLHANSADQLCSTEDLTCLADLAACKANGTGLSMVHSC